MHFSVATDCGTNLRKRALRARFNVAKWIRDPSLMRIGEWIQFEKLDGDGPDEGWLKYYSNGKRAAKRTAANDICIMQSNVGIAPEEVRPSAGCQAWLG